MPAMKGGEVSGECSAEKSLAEQGSQLAGERDSQRNSETSSLVSFMVGKHVLIKKQTNIESVWRVFQAEGKGSTCSFITLKVLINPLSVLMAILHSLTGSLPLRVSPSETLSSESTESIPSQSPLSGLLDLSLDHFCVLLMSLLS